MVAGSSTARTISGVQEHGHGQSDTHHLEVDPPERREDREHSDHHDRRARDDTCRGTDAVFDALGRHAAVVRLAHTAEIRTW